MVDVTDLPANLTPMQWREIANRVRATRQYARTEGGERELVSLRSARPSQRADAAPPLLFIGKIVVSRGVGSDGGGGQAVSDTTQRGQPVYAVYTGDEPREIRAIRVFHRDLPGIEFVFKPPREIPKEGFTAWIPATLQQTRDGREPSTRTRLFAGLDLPAGEVPANAPRIRYALRSLEEHHRHTDSRVRANRMVFVGEQVGFDPVKDGPRRVESPIPGC